MVGCIFTIQPDQICVPMNNDYTINDIDGSLNLLVYNNSRSHNSISYLYVVYIYLYIVYYVLLQTPFYFTTS